MGGGNPHTTTATRRPSRSITAWILTCPHRLTLLEQTLISIRETDWKAPLRIHCTPSGGEQGDPAENPIHRAHLAVLKSAIEGPGTHFLILEDDVSFNRHLHHNVTHWDLWDHAETVDFATLYNPGLREFAASSKNPGGEGGSKEPTFFAAEPRGTIGSQARLISRRCAEHLMSTGRGPGPNQDLRFSSEAAATFNTIWVHRPSLVQHLGADSTWEGPGHVACDFDPYWKAGVNLRPLS
jgi:hypothetical protein